MPFANPSHFRAPAGHRLCRHLRCKEMYYSTQEMAERGAADPAALFEGKIFWCLKTFKADGPDADRCGADECKPDRGCYQE